MTISISVSPVAVSGLQSWLTRQWLKAEAWQDKREPETPQVLANLERIWQGMVRFEAVERSLRRAGYEGCIAPDRGCSEQVISCDSCAVSVPETHDKPLVVSDALPGDPAMALCGKSRHSAFRRN